MENNSNRDKILSFLYCSSGNWVSGEDISSRLGISRTAVWKNIKILREKGYCIESSNRLGHKLLSAGNPLNENDIRRDLKSSVFGQGCIYIFEKTGSTNVEAFKLAASGAPEGIIVLADQQESGKGRLGRTWVSPSGKNIYISLILRPQIPAHLAPRLTLVAATALSDTLLEKEVTGHMIKWPNDILAGGKKLSGILTEMKGDTDSIDFIITGIGINVNSTIEDYPEEIRETATSIKILKNREEDRAGIVRSLLYNFEKYYNIFLQGEYSSILKIWKERADIIGREISVRQFSDTFTGRVTELNEDGNLIVDTGISLRVVNSGDINYLNP